LKPTFSFLILSLIWSGCAQHPDSILVQTGPPQEIPINAGDAVEFEVDSESSKVLWIGTKPTGRHNGTIAISDGSIYVKNGIPAGGMFTMDMHDIQIDNMEGKQKTKLNNHLLSSDFFDVENHPVSRFVITALEPYDSQTSSTEAKHGPFVISDPTHIVTGNFYMRGTNLSISFPAKIHVNEHKVEAEAKFNIDRTKWGVSYWDESTIETRTQDKLIHNVVHVAFTLEAVK